MLKFLELRSPTSCLNKASNEEPVFVLRAKDSMAPQTVRLWASMSHGIHEEDKVDEAFKCAAHMEEWRKQNVPETDRTMPPEMYGNDHVSYKRRT